MGWWDESIMGGDTPLDYKGNFEDRFGSQDPVVNEWRVEDGKEPIPFVVPSAADAVQFITEFKHLWGDGDAHILKQVTGFLMIERAAPFDDDLRALVIEGLDEEIAEGCETWNEPARRLAALNEFRELVLVYPNEGGVIKMPHQAGLFEKFAEKLG